MDSRAFTVFRVGLDSVIYFGRIDAQWDWLGVLALWRAQSDAVIGAPIVVVVAKVLGISAGILAVLLFPSLVMLKFVSLYPPIHGRGRIAILLMLAVLFLPAIVYDYGWLSDSSTEPQGAPVTWAILIVVGLLLVCGWLVYVVIRLRSSSLRKLDQGKR